MRKNMPHQIMLALAVLCIITPLEPALADDPLILEFEQDRALISGFAPGADIGVFAASWSDLKPAPSLETGSDVLKDQDHDGVVEYVPPEGHLAPATMIVAVDLDTGALVFGRPGTRPIRILNGAGRLGPLDGEEDIIVPNAVSIHVLLVRPRTGFWHAVIDDGSELDSDGEVNQSISIDAESLIPRGASPAAPRDPAPEDLLFLVEPYFFGIQVIEVG